MVTAAQMRRLDQMMIDEIGIDLVRMMENAGRALAKLAVRVFDPDRVVVLAGTGGNGGGGLVAARHLANRGREVRVVLSRPATALTPVSRRQHDIAARMGIPIRAVPTPLDAVELVHWAGHPDLIIDALIGYRLRGDPTGSAAALIDWANTQPARTLSLDIPSGLDATSGRIGIPCVRAAATLALALPKLGMRGAEPVGELWLADISVPRIVYRGMGIEVGDLFHRSGIVSLDRDGCIRPLWR